MLRLFIYGNLADTVVERAEMRRNIAAPESADAVLIFRSDRLRGVGLTRTETGVPEGSRFARSVRGRAR